MQIDDQNFSGIEFVDRFMSIDRDQILGHAQGDMIAMLIFEYIQYYFGNDEWIKCVMVAYRILAVISGLQSSKWFTLIATKSKIYAYLLHGLVLTNHISAQKDANVDLYVEI